MQNIGYIIDKLLRNHISKIAVIHWISYQPFEQPGPGVLFLDLRLTLCSPVFNIVAGYEIISFCSVLVICQWKMYMTYGVIGGAGDVHSIWSTWYQYDPIWIFASVNYQLFGISSLMYVNFNLMMN